MITIPPGLVISTQNYYLNVNQRFIFSFKNMTPSKEDTRDYLGNQKRIVRFFKFTILKVLLLGRLVTHTHLFWDPFISFGASCLT